MPAYTILGDYLIPSAYDNPKMGWGLRIQDNRITDIGPNAEIISKYGNDNLLDAAGKIIMPGFVNTHIHMYGMFAHGMVFEKPATDLYYLLLDEWWPKVEDKMDHEAIRISSALAALSSIQSGVTTICDVMEAPYTLPGGLDVAGEVIDRSGLRAVLCFEASERVNDKYAQLGLEENTRFIRENPTGHGRLSGMMCVHTTFSCSLPFLKKGRQLASKLGSQIHMHISESRYEALYCLRTYGKLPFEVYESIGFLGPDVLASQCVHTRSKEVPIMSKYGVKVTHQPLANAQSGCGIAPIPEFLAHDLTVGIGSDGLQKNHFEVLRGAIFLNRGHLTDGTVLSSRTIFDMATASGAKALGLRDLGKLEPGNLADIVLLDASFSVPVTTENIYDLVVFHREPRHIKTVIIDGKIVMKDGEMLTLDESSIFSEARSVAQRIWEKR